MSIRMAGFSESPSASGSHRMRRPSASVLPISMVSPLRVGMMSIGLKALPETRFSTVGSSTRRRILRLPAISRLASPRTLAPPPMSFFISFMPAAGFRS